MGDLLGLLFHRLWNECAWLHLKWNQYVALFGSKPSRVGILNAAAPTFFRIIQDTLWEDVLLHISRLTDPPRSIGKDNLTLHRLPALVDQELSSDIENLVKKAQTACAFARDWRNRHIAHRDLDLALGQNATALAKASRANVHAALASIVAVLDAVEAHYEHSTTAYGVLPSFAGAEDLLFVLRDGIQTDEERRKRLSAGKPRPEDLKPPAPV
jgi:hypothetical protein